MNLLKAYSKTLRNIQIDRTNTWFEPNWSKNLLIVIRIAYEVFVFIILNEINFFRRSNDVVVCAIL